MIIETLEKGWIRRPVECGPGEKCEMYDIPCHCYGGTVLCEITYANGRYER